MSVFRYISGRTNQILVENVILELQVLVGLPFQIIFLFLRRIVSKARKMRSHINCVLCVRLLFGLVVAFGAILAAITIHRYEAGQGPTTF